MTMTKAERATMEQLKTDLRLARALRWTEPVEPDIEPPKYGEPLRKGFLFAGCKVEKACTTGGYHSFGRDDKIDQQRPCPLYSSRLRCLHGLRHALEVQYAAILAQIDVDIENERNRSDET